MFLAGCGGTAASAPVDPAPAPLPPVSSVPAPEEPPAPDPVQTYLDGLSVDEKLGQLFFVRCPVNGGERLAASEKCPGGYLLFGNDFADRTADEAKARIANFQAAAKTPLLIGVDEEGGTVVRVSRHLRNERFASPRALYEQGGLEAILSDAIEKDAFLSDFGINVNLAPVADLSTDPNDFIYPRTLGEDAATTAGYIAAVVRQMDADNMGNVLKHFPGYGPNADTHTGSAFDPRPLEDFETADLRPFIAGIDAGADAVLVSHNVVPAFGDTLPGSLSPAVVGYLRDTLGFDGVILTDDLAMDAVVAFDDAALRAVQAGCDLIITSDFETGHAQLRRAYNVGNLTMQQIDAAAYRVLAWKFELNLLQY